MGADRVLTGQFVAPPRFGILGPLQVTDAAHRPVPLGGPRARELLALLLLSPNRSLSSERLVSALWGESASEGAATTLRTHIATVRRVLAAAGADDALETTGPGYRLVLESDDLDADVFEDLVHRGQEALGIGEPERAAALLTDALALWRGDILDDLGPPDSAATAIARLTELRVAAEEAAMAAALAMGQHRDVVARLGQLVAAHPFHEQFTGQLMVALYRGGRQADALAAYDQAKRRLAEELGLDPGPDLRTLHTAVLRQDPALLLTVEDVARGTEIDPTLSTTRTPATRQPPDAVFTALRREAMVGRAAALSTLTDTWQAVVDGDRAVLALSGAAGVGKSRLAAELTHLAIGDGASVLIGRCDAAVPFAATASALGGSASVQRVAAGAPAGVRARLHPLLPLDPDAAIEPLGVGSSAGPEQRQALARVVEWVLAALAAHAPVLLVVEDAERLEDDESSLLGSIATRLPERTLLAICFRDPPGTRHPPLANLVGRRGVHELTRHVALDALSSEDLGQLVATLHPGEAATSAAVVEALWQQTAGNPFFARELLRDVDPVDLRDGRVGQGLPVGVRDVLRHRLGLLPDDTREAVAGAAVLGRDVELTRLSRLLAIPEERVVPMLEPALTSGFLVEAGHSWSASYAFPHELMREAVYAEISPPRRQRLHHRAIDAILGGGHSSDADVIAAAGHALKAGPATDAASAADLVERAAHLAADNFGYDMAIRLAEARLPLLRRFAEPMEQARADVEVARLRLRSGRGYDRVVELLERALATYLSLGDTQSAGAVHSRLGGTLVVPRPGMDVVRSLEHFAAAERLLPHASDLFSLHRGRLSAAMHALDTETMAAAVDRCAAIAVSSNRPQLDVAAGWGRGWLALDRGRPTASLSYLEDAWWAANDLGDPLLGWPPANAGALICTVYLLDPTTGRSWCRRGLGQRRFDTLTHPNDTLTDQLALALAMTGELDAAQRAAARLPAEAVARRLLSFLLGDWEGAAAQWQSALEHDLAAGDRHDAVANARWLADALLALGDERGAAERLELALDIAASAPQVPSEVAIRARLAGLPCTAPESAAIHLSRCEEVAVAGEDWRGLAGEVAMARAAVALKGHDWAAAAAAATEAASVFHRYRLPWRRAAALQSWARALAGAGRVSEARAGHEAADAVLAGIEAPERWRRGVFPS